MSKTLTQLIANVQALLLDDGTRFTTATVTAAIRSALRDYNLYAPVHQSTLIDVVAEQKDYELSDSPDAETAIEISDILLWDADGDNHMPLPYEAFTEDERLFFRLRYAQSAGDFLLARFTQPHTVSGLDSETESTIPAYFDNVLIDGGCYWACVIRALGRVEPINLNQGVTENLSETKDFFYKSFMEGLRQAARRKPAVSEPSAAAWNDGWHGREV